MGTNAVIAPNVETEHRHGAFSATIEYGALYSAAGHQVSSEVAWDDDWFFQDPTAYNQELAHTCAVLSAVANAESGYYQQGSTAPAYAERAFADLGFEEVSTASYRYRSEVMDEIIGLVDGTDVVAYSVATKHVRSSQTGEEKLLTVVAVRGSYGSEWLSNANIGESDSVEDHLGFTLAAEEIVADLNARAERTYLFCGHSRGGAVSNLLASYADGVSGDMGAISSAESVRAYTFAAPNCTTDPAARSERYDNIFNVLNPSDAVTMLLPTQWGYARHGRDVWLPTMTEDTELTQAMSASYEASMGVACPVKIDALALSEEFVGFLTDRVGGVDDLFSVGGAMAIAQACFGFDVGQVLTSHYPNTYIAWLDVTTAEDLRIE